MHRNRRGGRRLDGEVEQPQRVRCGQRADTGAGEPATIGGTEIGGHRVGLVPQSPGQGGGGQAESAPVPGQCVEVGVGRGVVGLARTAEHARGAGEHGELGQVAASGQLVQMADRVDLGCEDPVHALRGQRPHHAVVEHARDVDDGGQRVLGGDRGEQLGHGGPVGQVAGDDAGTELGQLGGPGRGGTAAAGEQQVPGPLSGEVAHDTGTESAGGTGDQNGSFGVTGARHGEHDLADVLGLADEPERRGGLPHVPVPAGQVVQNARLEQVDQLGEHLADALGPGLDEVEGLVEDVLGVAQVRLAHLQEPPAVPEQAQRGVDELARQRVEHHVDRVEPVGETEITGRRQVLDTQFAHRIPLGGAGGAVHLGAPVAGQLHGRHPDAARGGVDQDGLAPPQVGEVAQGVVGGEEHQRHGGGVLERPVRGNLGEHAGVGDGGGAERLGHHAEHALAGTQRGDAGPDLGHHTRALAAHGDLARVHAQREEDVAEVDARGSHGQPHLVLGQRPVCGAGQRAHRVHGALRSCREPPGAVGGGGVGGAGEAGGMRDVVTDGDLRLRDGQAEHVGGQLGVGAVEIDQDEAAGVLRLGGTDQTVHGGAGQVCRVGGVERGTDGEDDQPRLGEAVVGQPALHHLECGVGGGVRVGVAGDRRDDDVEDAVGSRGGEVVEAVGDGDRGVSPCGRGGHGTEPGPADRGVTRGGRGRGPRQLEQHGIRGSRGLVRGAQREAVDRDDGRAGRVVGA